MKNLLLFSKLMYHENPFGELPKCIETLAPALTSIWQAFEWLTPIAWAVAIVIDIPLFPSFYCFHTHLVTFSTCLMPSDVYWWGFVMMTSSSGNIYSALLTICAGNSPVIGEFPAQRPMTRSFDGFFDLRLNIRLRKQSLGLWFETPSRPLWRHRNVLGTSGIHNIIVGLISAARIKRLARRLLFCARWSMNISVKYCYSV